MSDQLDLWSVPPPPEEPPDDRTLNEARQSVIDDRDEGCICPCCDQYVKVYRRNMNSARARALVWLVDHTFADPEAWVVKAKEAPKWIANMGGEFAKLRHWGLIEEQFNDDTKKKNSGVWRTTRKGRMYVWRRLTVPLTCILYNNDLLGFSEEHVSIVQALGDKYDFSELMQRGPSLQEHLSWCASLVWTCDDPQCSDCSGLGFHAYPCDCGALSPTTTPSD